MVQRARLTSQLRIILMALSALIYLRSYSTNDDKLSTLQERRTVLKRSVNFSPISATLKSPQSQLYHQQQQPSPYQMSTPTYYQQQQPARWFPPTSPSALREPLNVPTMINQADANSLERYMKNNFVDGNNQTPLDLASINDRAARLVIPSGANQKYPPSKQQQQQHQVQNSNFQERSDPPLNQIDGQLVKKGRVDDVLLFKTHNPLMNNEIRQQPPPSPAQQLTSRMNHKPKLLFDKWTENCISRATPFATRCEDHLIKRLYQDAAEGRTVIDVGRRVCCALFWHKDCISRIVVESCPDSNPIAADYLMGSRKLDLTLSCQKFNRDGCNGSPDSLKIHDYLCLIYIVFTYVVINIFI